ncbi:MAG: amidohydrolase family protein [Actinobacteria bacterium]|nr:amidohydrolase family protein [Actinomycetota bacterium]
MGKTLRSLLIKNGRVIDPASNSEAVADLLIRDGCIANIGQLSTTAEVTIEAEGMLVTPGLIDMHTHLREPGHEQAETIQSGSQAAVGGGFTTVAAMPNTKPCIDNAKMVSFVKEQAQKADLCRVLVVGAVTVGRQGQELAGLEAMAQAGAMAFSDDGDCVATTELMRKALAEASKLNKTIIQHCEDPQTTRGDVNAAIAEAVGLSGSSEETEAEIVERDLKLLGNFSGRYHVAHVSAAATVEVIRKAKLRGVNVTAEVTPHHLALTDELCRSLDPVYKVRPPLRSAVDVAALKAALAEGTIDCLACDHAPHTSQSKALGFSEAPAGMIGLETALGVYVTELIEGGVLSWMRLIEMLTVKPAAVLGLDRPSLAVGQRADITIIDPARKWKVEPEKFHSKGRNCPFAGKILIGKAVATIVAGELKKTPGKTRG